MTLTDFVNAVQVGLTLTFVLFCILLLRTWWGSYKTAARQANYVNYFKAKRVWDAEQWLVVGIVSGFAANLLDNSFWGFAWLTVLFELSIEGSVFEKGPLSNIFLRQLPGIWAVYCHVRAAQLMTKKHFEHDLDTMSWVYFAVGAVATVGLVVAAKLL